jgi:hypothetical protein
MGRLKALWTTTISQGRAAQVKESFFWHFRLPARASRPSQLLEKTELAAGMRDDEARAASVGGRHRIRHAAMLPFAFSRLWREKSLRVSHGRFAQRHFTTIAVKGAT